MKRKVLVILLIFMSSFVFSKSFFSERYFEVKTVVPASVSTNSIGVVNFFQKEVVIDFSKIAERMPENGFDFSFFASPKVETTVNIPNVLKIGPRVGVDVFGEMNLSKSLFDFIGNGNTINEPTNVSATAGMDLFYFYGLFVEAKVHKLTVGFTPNLFVPLLSMSLKDMSFSLNNTEDGKFILNGTGAVQIYSNADFSNGFEQGMDNILDNMQNGFGFDLNGCVGWDFTNDFTLSLNYKVPIVPGRYKVLSSYNVDFENEFSLLDMQEDKEVIETDEESMKKEKDFSPVIQEIDYKIYRPMKFNLGINYNPFGHFFSLSAFAGVGIQHPFMEDFVVYPEYYCNLKVSLIGLLSAQFSTEYIDRVFAHSFIASLNLRLIQFDAGVSFSSLNFVKSFTGSGVGAFVAVSVGF